MSEITFEVKGTFQEKFAWKPYTKVLTAPNEKQATERIYNVFGSKHHLKRAYIKIESVKRVSGA